MNTWGNGDLGGRPGSEPQSWTGTGPPTGHGAARSKGSSTTWLLIAIIVGLIVFVAACNWVAVQG